MCGTGTSVQVPQGSRGEEGKEREGIASVGKLLCR